jgi:outer membrane protein
LIDSYRERDLTCHIRKWAAQSPPDSAIVEVQKNNARVLEQAQKQTRDRLNIGEVTRTDIAQSEAQLAAGTTQQLTAEANLTMTRANFPALSAMSPGPGPSG